MPAASPVTPKAPKKRSARAQYAKRTRQGAKRDPARDAELWAELALTEDVVKAMVKARALGLPLSTAAEIVGVSPEMAQKWLSTGRMHRSYPNQDALGSYNTLARSFAIQWDAAAASTLLTLRDYMLEHAKKDPRACAEMLAAYEGEYRARGATVRHQLDSGATLAQVELAEPHVPLQLPGITSQRGGSTKRFSVTNPDGSSASAEFTDPSPGARADGSPPAGSDPWDEDNEHRSIEDLEHYAEHGRWPEEMPKLVIDTEGEDVNEQAEADPAAAAELVRELQGTLYDPDAPAPGAPQPSPPAARPPASVTSLPRIDVPQPIPEGVVKVESHQEPQRIQIVAPAAPLRRYDPMAGR